ncbi:hypothetical protein K432DRAFT_319242 [Lepidopterella palustris CBS 459.81]|uniref:Uncharacterized protein n=1 Tax=Lepidopterella palustris CBS 459.81 TaxID=1314670 RepID=A0A8E2EJG1_9PEZI|nr:hypothetical protein K432DRAFT_319242 [Lepidopterella palustris CBS 459.81]
MTARQTQRSSLLIPQDVASSPPSSAEATSAASPAPEPIRTFTAPTKPRTFFYRPIKPLTYELRNHSTVYLEDGQYVEAFAFLNNLLVSATSTSTPDRPHQAFIPPPQHLALASTLIVYPPVTTKAKSLERQYASNAALRYLRNVCKTVDPLSENLLVAFTFSGPGSTRRGGRHWGAEPESPDSDDGERTIKSNVANASSLYQRAEDFWQIVGWAFNCSLCWKKRWERWRLWLELMLDFLEADWHERSRLSMEEGADVEQLFTQSLIWQYTASRDPQSRASRRRILRAILADGNGKSLKEFTEVFKNETKEVKIEEGNTIKHRKVLDIENGEFGDYGVDDDEDAIMDDVDVRTSKRLASRRAFGKWSSPNSSNESMSEDEDEMKSEESSSAVDRLGGIDAVGLRQRLLAIIADVALAVPKLFTNIEDLFDLYTEFFRPLPTSTFGCLLSTSKLPSAAQIMLNVNLLLPLLASNFPRHITTLPAQEHLERYFLPFPAINHSYADNAKISLILESILMQMMDSNALEPTDGLKAAILAGVAAREKKACGDARRKKGRGNEEDWAKEIMQMSKERLLGLLDILELATSPPSGSMDDNSNPQIEGQSSPLSSAISMPSGSLEEEENDMKS